ncbi:hypothetical protein [Marinimicrobium sp. C2-29]|uniref:hypothetical protein n=1 Tax=Marinimicrobium sp. C2-29 TaxID=3139825 RepID=UPI0031387DAC
MNHSPNEQQLNGSLEQRYAEQTYRQAMGRRSPAEATTLFIGSTRLLALCRDVEHAAFMQHEEAHGAAPRYDTDFNQQLLERLGQMKEQMVFMGKVIKAGEGAS